MIGQAYNNAFSEHLSYRIYSPFPCLAINDVENVFQRLARSFWLVPAGQVLGNRIHVFEICAPINPTTTIKRSMTTKLPMSLARRLSFMILPFFLSVLEQGDDLKLIFDHWILNIQ